MRMSRRKKPRRKIARCGCSVAPERRCCPNHLAAEHATCVCRSVANALLSYRRPAPRLHPSRSTLKDFDPQDFHWVLPAYQYKEPKQLLATLAENVIAPAEGKVKALEERRRMIEAELTKPQ